MCMTIARDGGTGGVWDLKEGLLQKPTGPVQSVYSLTDPAMNDDCMHACMCMMLQWTIDDIPIL